MAIKATVTYVTPYLVKALSHVPLSTGQIATSEAEPAWKGRVIASNGCELTLASLESPNYLTVGTELTLGGQTRQTFPKNAVSDPFGQILWQPSQTTKTENKKSTAFPKTGLLCLDNLFINQNDDAILLLSPHETDATEALLDIASCAKEQTVFICTCAPVTKLRTILKELTEKGSFSKTSIIWGDPTKPASLRLEALNTLAVNLAEQKDFLLIIDSLDEFYQASIEASEDLNLPTPPDLISLPFMRPLSSLISHCLKNKNRLAVSYNTKDYEDNPYLADYLARSSTKRLHLSPQIAQRGFFPPIDMQASSGELSPLGIALRHLRKKCQNAEGTEKLQMEKIESILYSLFLQQPSTEEYHSLSISPQSIQSLAQSIEELDLKNEETISLVLSKHLSQLGQYPLQDQIKTITNLLNSLHHPEGGESQ